MGGRWGRRREGRRRRRQSTPSPGSARSTSPRWTCRWSPAAASTPATRPRRSRRHRQRGVHAVFYPGQPALGKTLMTYAEPGYPETHYEIVGVFAGRPVTPSSRGGAPAALVPEAQFPAPMDGAVLLVRSARCRGCDRHRQASAHAPIRPCASTVRLGAAVRTSLVRERLMAMLSGFFGALAALLARLASTASSPT